MEEDIQKNFILLSKVAKEKKYAQEYMGLLARRGDIGSIRIGKRWYTTWAWFEEFLENSQKKSSVAKTSASPADKPKKAESEIIVSVEKKVEQVETNVPLFFPQREKVSTSQSVIRVHCEENVIADSATFSLVGGQKADRSESIAVAVKTRKFEIPVRKNISEDISEIGEIGEKEEIKMQPKIAQGKNFHQERNGRFVPQVKAKFKNDWGARKEARKMELPQIVSIQKKNENPLPYKEVKFRKNQDVFSPVFGSSESIEKVRSAFFPKLVFATSFAIMFFLIAASGYFVFSDGIFKKGTVAGVSNERNGVFAGINSGGEYFLASAGDKMKESLSVSRVVVEAAKERSVNNEQKPEISAN
jgi:hypothetical protein